MCTLHTASTLFGEESILNLRDQLSKLRVHAQKASQEVRVIMTDVEKQFEELPTKVGSTLTHPVWWRNDEQYARCHGAFIY